MRYAIIHDGTVINIIEAEASFAAQIGAVPAETSGTHAAIGGTWDGTAFGQAEPAGNPAPASVSRAQGKAALIHAGIWSAVLDYVADIADPTEQALAEVALHDTIDWRRASPFLNSAAAALGLSGDDLDDLFRTASTIEL